MAAVDAALKSSAKSGLVDRLIHARAVRVGAQLYTFEKAARKLPGTKVLG